LSNQVRIQLRRPIDSEQPVLLLLDVGELRVAKDLDRAGVHQRVDQLAIYAQELAAVLDLQPAPTAGRGDANAAKLGDQQRLAAIAVAGGIDGRVIVWMLERGIEGAIAPREGG